MSLPLAVFVPAHGNLGIKQGSGIVGSDAADFHGVPMMKIDFEGNLYGAENMRTYADRVRHAASRHENYPTMARMTVPEDALVYVGDFDGTCVSFDPANFRALVEWLGMDPDGSLFDPRELLVTP